VVLLAAAARQSPDPAVSRTWTLMAAALGVYCIGNLINSTYWLFDRDPFPSVGDVFFLAFYPLVFAAVLNVIRTASLRVAWGRLALDGTILVLGFGAFFWFCVIRPSVAADGDADHLRYALTQAYIGLNCLMVMAFGMLIMAGGGGQFRSRTLVLLTLGFATMFLADIVWAMAKVTGQYLPGGISDAVYLWCYVELGAAAREHLRSPAAVADRADGLAPLLVQGLPYAAMLVSFIVLVYFTRGEAGDTAPS
jgi:hypothetical protein